MRHNKIFIVFLFIILLFYFSIVNVSFAETIHLPDVSNLLDDEYKYYVCFQNPQSNKYYLAIAKEKSLVWSFPNNAVFTKINNESKLYVFNGTAWISEDISNMECCSFFNNQLAVDYYNTYGVTTLSCIRYSNFDIYTAIDSNNTVGDIFFQQTHLSATKILTVETVKEIPLVVVGTLKVIIPVGLVVLSVVFLIYLIKWVISRVV